jgi:EAL and modified HD-GYP domain-containing signal transduction protein
MDIFLARQPIFNNRKTVYGYEILYRDSENNFYSGKNGDYASGNVLTRCFLDFGINDLTNNKKAFINFTDDLLKNNIATIFPKEYLVVEILEDVFVDDEIMDCCRKLKSLGYTLALDDFVFKPCYEQLLKLVDIIKVDFKISNAQETKDIVNTFKRRGLSFLAEKIETPEEYKRAVEAGYTYFQGYYFSKPEITFGKKFSPYEMNRFKLINMLNMPEPEFGKLASLIENDLAFSYEILRLVNSAYFGRMKKITSVRSAIVTLGLDEIKKWLYLAYIRDTRQDKPEEIINICMLRGKFLEKIAEKAQRIELCSELQTLGMFSMIDVLLNKPMKEIMQEINFSDEIKLVLQKQDKSSFLALSYETVLKYEKGQWKDIPHCAERLNIPLTDINDAYIESIIWLKDINNQITA